MTDRRAGRELRLAVLLCLLGAVVVTVTVARGWAAVEQPGDALRPGSEVGLPGSLLVPGLRALGLVGLAGVVALAATRGRGRTFVGLLLLAAGAVVAWQSVRVAVDLRDRVNGSAEARELVGLPPLPASPAPAQSVLGGARVETVDVTATAWPWACAVGGLLLLLAGLLVTVRGRRWSALSSRYEPPTGQPPPSAQPTAPPAAPAALEDKQLWDDLDIGRDPTQDPAADSAQDPTRR